MTDRVGVVQVYDRRFDRQGPALRHRIAGVDREVEDDLLELTRIGEHERRARMAHLDQVDVLPDESSDESLHFVRDLVQVDDLRLEQLLPTEGQKLPSQGCGAIGGLLDRRHVLAALVIGGKLFSQHPRVAGNHSEKVVEIVGHTARQLPDGFHLLGLTELVLGLLPIGDIEDVTRQLDQLSRSIE